MLYKCKECKTVYNDKVDYCECGNNVFDEIEETPLVEDNQEVTVEEILPEPVSGRRTLVSFQEIVSYAIFGACCLFSLIFILFLGPKPAEMPSVTEKTKVAEQKEIPQIDKIWDDTPTYTVYAHASLENYKNDLKNVLSENFSLPKFDGEGSCEIEFIIDSAGRLKHKKLIRNTANKPLENSAKKMLSKVSKVTPPPANYDGTPFRLIFLEQNNEYVMKYKE